MKRILAILGVMILVFVVGCDTEKSTPLTARTFVGGSDAILIDFETDSPPPEVYDGGDFDFKAVIRVTNAGEHTVPKAEIKFSLEGLPPSDFLKGETNPEDLLKDIQISEDELEATSIDSDGNQMPGTTTYVEIPADDKYLNFKGTLRGNNPWTIRVNACYKYRTQAQVDLCILSDLKRRAGKVCVVDEVKSVQSSSSPVLVSNFRENVAGTNKISFSFDVSKSGDGKISKATPSPGKEACSSDHTERDKVFVTVNTGIDKELRCSALSGGTGDGVVSGEVTLFGGKRIVTCTQDISGEGDYIKKAYIDVKFYYKDYIEKGILVKHTTEGTS